MNKVRSTILIIAAIAGGAPIFHHSETKPVPSSQETNNTTEAQVSPMEKKEKL